jgi:dihydroorotase
MTSAAPAKAFGLYPRKGALLAGSDADVVVVDLARAGMIASELLQSKGSSTPFDQVATTAAPIHTLVRGRFVMRDRALVVEALGHGRSVRRIQAMPTPAPRNTETTTAAITAKRS